MKIRTVSYYIREAFRSIIMNRLMSVASIFTVASCIFIVSVFFILASHVSFFVHQMGNSLELVVFIEDNVTDLERNRLEVRIREIPHVTNIRFVSSEEALRNLREWMGNPPFLDGIDERNPLRASFEMELSDVAYQEQVVQALSRLAEYGASDVRRSADLARMLATLADVVQMISVTLILILGIVAIVIITNTISITVNARRTEIGIMKYVGATDWFIRWPFIIEGVIIGLIGGLIPTMIAWIGHDRAVGMLAGIPDLQFIVFLPRGQIFVTLFPFAILLGTIIGLVGSGVSVRRHLKV